MNVMQVSQTALDHHLLYLVNQIMHITKAEAAALYQTEQDQMTLLVETTLAAQVRGRLKEQVRAHLPLVQPVTIPAQDFHTHSQCALLLPVPINEQMSGVLALLSKGVISVDAEASTEQELVPLLGLLSALLTADRHQRAISGRLQTVEALLYTAGLIAEQPSPQHVVDILRENLLAPHISSCAVLLFGPQREDKPQGDFDYLELRGTWSKRVGSGVGIGVRLYLDDYPDLLADLERGIILTFPNVSAIRARFDPLVRAFLRAERVRSLTLIALHRGGQQLGVLTLATDKPHVFTDAELQDYRTVGEFMTMGVLAQLLYRQREHMEQYRAALLDAVTDAVVMVVPGGAGGTVLTANARFGRLFEIGQRKPEGDSLVALLNAMQIPEQVRTELRAAWLGTPVRDSAIRGGEFRMINAEGQTLDIGWYSAPVYQEQLALGRIYIFHDLTSERTAQRLRASFLSRVSHELRTPLTSIRGFAEFILEAVGDQLPDLAREYTEIIHQSAKHLNAVFSDMIEITRADAGELKLNKTDTHLPDIIIEVVARMELAHKQRKQRVILDIDDKLPHINADVDRISQVITNLLSNAIKYSPEGGTITIHTMLVEAARDLPDDAPRDVVLPAVLVTVQDEGNGLNDEDAINVFMPFFRTNDTKTQRIEGAGLGLAVTRSIVEMHRGKIWARPNTRGEGGCFQFTLPIVRE